MPRRYARRLHVTASTATFRGRDVGSIASPQKATATSRIASIVASRTPGSFRAPMVETPGTPSASQGTPTTRRLVVDQLYFGVEARAFHAGAERMLKRISAHASERARINVRTLGEDFRLDGAASWALLRALVGAKLLHPEGAGSYVATARFREYALASVVMPLSRARAKALIEEVGAIAARINADWNRNPYVIKLVAVSGSYMSRRDRLPELSLWVVLRRRLPLQRRRRSTAQKDTAMRRIVAEVCAPSSFIRLRLVRDKQEVQRPFSVVYQTNEGVIEPSGPAWEKLRDWGASISRRLAAR